MYCMFKVTTNNLGLINFKICATKTLDKISEYLQERDDVEGSRA